MRGSCWASASRTTMRTMEQYTSSVPSLFSLAGRVALVTGAYGFFGRYFTRALLASGASVVLVDREADPTFTTALDREFGASRHSTILVDLSDHAAVAERYAELLGRCAVDILVNNAFEFSPRTGFAPDRSGDLLASTTAEELMRGFESGVLWSVEATQRFGAAMQRRGQGSIITIASMYAAVTPDPLLYEGTTHAMNPVGYPIAKAGLVAFTKYAAALLAPVRVNAILPGAFPNFSESPDRAGKRYDPVFLRRLADRTLLRRVGNPAELVGPLLFLAADASSYVTGHALMVDGGWTVK